MPQGLLATETIHPNLAIGIHRSRCDSADDLLRRFRGRLRTVRH